MKKGSILAMLAALLILGWATILGDRYQPVVSTTAAQTAVQPSASSPAVNVTPAKASPLLGTLPKCASALKVVPGDTMIRLFGKKAYLRVARVNGIANPNIIRVGQNLCIPEGVTVKSRYRVIDCAATKLGYCVYSRPLGDRMCGVRDLYDAFTRDFGLDSETALKLVRTRGDRVLFPAGTVLKGLSFGHGFMQGDVLMVYPAWVRIKGTVKDMMYVQIEGCCNAAAIPVPPPAPPVTPAIGVPEPPPRGDVPEPEPVPTAPPKDEAPPPPTEAPPPSAEPPPAVPVAEPPPSRLPPLSVFPDENEAFEVDLEGTAGIGWWKNDLAEGRWRYAEGLVTTDIGDGYRLGAGAFWSDGSGKSVTSYTETIHVDGDDGHSHPGRHLEAGWNHRHHDGDDLGEGRREHREAGPNHRYRHHGKHGDDGEDIVVTKTSTYRWNETTGIGPQLSIARYTLRETTDEFGQTVLLPHGWSLKARYFPHDRVERGNDLGYHMVQTGKKLNFRAEYARRTSPDWIVGGAIEWWHYFDGRIRSTWSGDRPQDRGSAGVEVFGQYRLSDDWQVRLTADAAYQNWDGLALAGFSPTLRFRETVICGPRISFALNKPDVYREVGRSALTTRQFACRLELGHTIRVAVGEAERKTVQVKGTLGPADSNPVEIEQSALPDLVIDVPPVHVEETGVEEIPPVSTLDEPQSDEVPLVTIPGVVGESEVPLVTLGPQAEPAIPEVNV